MNTEAMQSQGEVDVAALNGLTPSEVAFANKVWRRRRQRTPGAFGSPGNGPKVRRPRGRRALAKRLFDLRIRQANFQKVLRKKGAKVEKARLLKQIQDMKKGSV
jgi:hypothetical protein